MPLVSGIGNLPPVQPPLGSGHGDHGANTAIPIASPGQSFSTSLAQAIDRSPGSGAHGGHGVANGGSGHTASTSVANSGSHPRHFQIGESNHGDTRSLQEIALGVRAYRQQLIASNIANADTPGYKAVDIDFEEALRIARSIANTPPLTLSVTASGHISGQAQTSAPPYPLKYHTPYQGSADGNTVDMDVERSKFAENSMMWEFARDRVSSHYKHMMEMLQNLKD
jgi:flagellar basal-body rod protein FlgB